MEHHHLFEVPATCPKEHLAALVMWGMERLRSRGKTDILRLFSSLIKQNSRRP
jgi:hypothetical protein